MIEPDPSPLSLRDFHVLFTLLDGECHGYGLRKTIAARTQDALRLDPANLYRALQRLIDAGLVRDGERRQAPDSARMRRYYEITDAGRAAAAAEAERMRQLVSAAEAKQLIPRSTPASD